MNARARIRSPEATQVISWAKDRALTHPALKEKINEIESSYEIVFIPGILGSKLRIGDFVYGEHEIDAKNLFLATRIGLLRLRSWISLSHGGPV